INFLGTPSFPGPVEVSASDAAGLSNVTGTVVLTGNGTASFSFLAQLVGIFSVTVTARAGDFQLSTDFSITVTAPPVLPPPPPPTPPAPFSFFVTPASPNQVNANIPEVLQLQVIPDEGATSFNQPVTVIVNDGAQMRFDPLCGQPSGFISYLNGALTFVIQPPFTTFVSFCMSAGQLGTPSISDGLDPITIIGSTSGYLPAVTTYEFQIGVPEILVSPVTTFNIPSDGSVLANITVNGVGGFNLPLHVHVTGPGSFISGGGPVHEPLPDGISSPDCGPEGTAPGQDVLPGNSITCEIVNTTPSGSTTPIDLEVFATFGGGASVVEPFKVCALGLAAPSGCTPAVLRGDSQVAAARLKSEESDGGSAQLNVSPSEIQFSPLMPKEGDQVRILARVENNGTSDVQDVEATLVVNKETVATATVDIAAGKSKLIEFEWEAAYDPRLSVAISVEPQGRRSGFLQRVVAVPNLFVEPTLSIPPRQGRSLLVVRNGECGAFRFLNGAQSFCGGSSDIELTPTITGEGQLRVQIWTLNGGVIDLGPQPITGAVEIPEGGYQATALLEGGHLYAVNSQGKYALLYVARVYSDVDPRLARLARGSGGQPALQSLGDLLPDQLNALLDQARITVDTQWAYQEDGSRRFRYGFSGGSGRIPAPTVFRQPRVPEGGASPQ
ncbi:MAG: hypothetical protein HY647_04090, partial [Acidobacteria bacterium]|nr:hypothetical protein [Acidobacteriota bacterium]